MFWRFTNCTTVKEEEQDSSLCSFIWQVFQDTHFFFFLKWWNGVFVGGIKLPSPRDRDKLIPWVFSSPLHLGLKSWKKFVISHHKILLIVHWPIIPLSNINLPPILFSPGYFLHHHRNLGRGTFWNELIFLYHVSDHIDLPLLLVSASVYWEIYW